MEHSIEHLRKQAIRVERFFPLSIREKAEKFLFAFSALALSFSVFFVLLGSNDLAGIDSLYVLWPISQGIFLISFSLLLSTILLEIYIRSLYRAHALKNISLSALFSTSLQRKKKDTVHTFVDSPLGKNVCARLGLSKEMLTYLVKEKRTTYLPIDTTSHATLADLSAYLHEHDEDFRRFLDNAHVTKEYLESASHAVEKRHLASINERTLFGTLFQSNKEHKGAKSFNDAVRYEVDDIEYLFKVSFSEQSITALSTYFSENAFSYADVHSRRELIVALVEEMLHAHKRRYHAKFTILPADVRAFLIQHKSANV